MEFLKADISASFNLSCGEIIFPDSSPIIIGAFMILLFLDSLALKERNSSAMIEAAIRTAGSLIFDIQLSDFNEVFGCSQKEIFRQAEINIR